MLGSKQEIQRANEWASASPSIAEFDWSINKLVKTVHFILSTIFNIYNGHYICFCLKKNSDGTQSKIDLIGKFDIGPMGSIRLNGSK